MPTNQKKNYIHRYYVNSLRFVNIAFLRSALVSSKPSMKCRKRFKNPCFDITSNVSALTKVNRQQ